MEALQAALPKTLLLSVGHKSPSDALLADLLSTKPVKLHCRTSPQNKQMGNILEQRSQTGSQIYFVQMYDNQKHFKIGRFHVILRDSGLRKSDSTGWHWIVAAAFRCGLRCSVCHSPYQSLLFLIPGLFHSFWGSVWPIYRFSLFYCVWVI